MTAAPLVTVFCDAPGCAPHSAFAVGRNAVEARASLTGRGWRLNVAPPAGETGRRDYCPKHA